jgi:hypothetical protein
MRVGAVEVPLPQYQTPDSAGLDLMAALPSSVVLAPGERRLIPTGLALAIPPGFEGQVRPRSGLALRHGVGMVNAPGTIDADYRGELGVILVNHGAAGDRPGLSGHGRVGRWAGPDRSWLRRFWLHRRVTQLASRRTRVPRSSGRNPDDAAAPTSSYPLDLAGKCRLWRQSLAARALQFVWA